MNCDAIILPKLTRMINNSQMKADFDFVGNLTLADPSFIEDGEIDLILGVCGIRTNHQNGFDKV